MEEDTNKAAVPAEVVIPDDPELIAKALKEYEEETDRVRVLKRYPWLAKVLNTPKPK